MPTSDAAPGLDWRTRLLQAVDVPSGFQSLVAPVHRGSTTLFASAQDIADHWDQERTPYRYGLYGTPTTLELARRLASLEQVAHCFIVPGGQAAISLIYLACTRTGGHVLVPDSVYGPSRDFADRMLSRFDVDVEYYDPLIGTDIAGLLRPNTQLVWCESPGSVTMEVQDVPAIVRAAHSAGARVALDNTYASGVLFDAFAHGVDISMQALTKYVGGHSDLLLGSVSTGDDELYQLLGDAHQLLGMGVSPDDCSLALRGLQTLAVRLDRLQSSTVEVAGWLGERQEIEAVLHPAFADCPGHLTWRRDFSGSTSVFSIRLQDRLDRNFIVNFVDKLRLFRIGYGWGGVTSLVMPHFDLARIRSVGPLVRFNIGLEEPCDLIADLDQALMCAQSGKRTHAERSG